ncbi:MAG: hypothetical protein J6K78_00695 [Tidjanibacter sp.]|nr:hypothetical protein [Tidjanibacter sp.]
MKKIFNILMLAAVVALTSCNYEPEGWHGPIFEGKSSEVVFDKSKIDFAFGPEEETVIAIPVSRGIATEAFTTNIQILDADGASISANPAYALMVIEQAKFEANQYEAVATLTFDRRQFTAGTKVGFYLQMEDTQIKDDVTLCALSILRDYTWNEFCGATLASEFWAGMLGMAEVPCAVYKADGFPYYRIYNGATETLDIEFGFTNGVLCPLGTPDSYGDIEFETGVDYDAGAPIVRYCNVDPEACYYHPDYNAVVSSSYYYIPALGDGFSYLQDVWYCDKALVTE